VSKTAKHIAVALFQLSHVVTELGLVRPDALREHCTGEIGGESKDPPLPWKILNLGVSEKNFPLS